MAYTQEQIATALKSSARRWSFRHEIIEQNGDLKGIANVLDASVSNNDLADKVKRTGDFTLSADNNIDFFKDRLRSFARLRMPDGGWHEWCVGTFHLTTSGKKWKLTKRAVQQTSYEEVARNLAKDPRATKSGQGIAGAFWTDRWGPYCTYTFEQGGNDPIGIGTFARLTTTSSHSTMGFHLASNSDLATYANLDHLIPVVPGEQVKVSVFIRSSKNSAARITASFVDSSGVRISGVGTPDSQLQGGLWKGISIILTPPTNAVGVALKVDSNQTVLDPGDTWDGTGLLISDPNEDYFDGSMGEGQDYRYSWSGTPHASESVKEKITHSVETVTVPAIDVIDVEAYDSLLVLDEDKVLDRYVATVGTNYRDAVVTVLNSSGFTSHMIASTDLTLPADREWEPGTSKLKIINDLLSAINYKPLIMDPFGVPTSSPYQAPENAPPVWEYKVDRESVILPGIDVELDLFNIPNAWVVSVSEPDRPVLTATKINDDPNSVLSTVNRGRMIVEVVKPDSSERDEEGNFEAATQEILEAKLDRVAQEASQQYQIANFDTGLMPFHGSGDVCLIDYGEGLLRFREHEWKMELKAGGKMSHKFRRVVVL